MEHNFNNRGSVTVAENMRDSYSFTIFNAPAAGELDPVLLNVPPTEISFKPITKPHADFTGRVEYVHSAIECLSHPVTSNVQIQFPCLVIHALGGYGKTETAKKIASDCSQIGKFQHFIWVDSEDDTTMKKCLVAVMKQIRVAPANETFESPNFDSLLHRFYNLLVGRKHETFLIIFDNVVDFDKILNYLPLDYHATNIAVLMTSQRPFKRTSYGNVTNQQLDLMIKEEAMQLVEKILGRRSTDSEQDKQLLVEQSGRITLVLCVMASTIKFQRKYDRNYRIKDYLEKIRDEPAEYGDESKALDLNYDKSLQTIVRFAVAKLATIGGPLGKIAVQIFDRLTYCSSTNWLKKDFVKKYFRDICEQVNSMDMKLPMKPEDDLQVIRMAIEKLSEFSLAQLSDEEFFCELSVHRWIQASRRLDLKRSDNERNILKELLFAVPDMGKKDANNFMIWQHVADYADLVNEFYEEKGSLMEFPYRNIDVLEKVIFGLMQNADLKQKANFSVQIYEFIRDNFLTFTDIHDDLKRVVTAFDYDVNQTSAELISYAIDLARFDVVKWLINEKSCTPQWFHLEQCFMYFTNSKNYLQKLQKLNIDLGEIIEQNSGNNLLDCLFTYALNELESLHLSWTSQCIESYEIESILSALEYSEPSKDEVSGFAMRSTLPDLTDILRVGFGEIIQRNPGKSLLECLFRYVSINLKSLPAVTNFEICRIIEIMLCASEKLQPLNIHPGEEIVEKNPYGNNLLRHLFHSELNSLMSYYMKWTIRSIQAFEIVGVILCAMQPSTELSVALVKYSERNLFECICKCGGSHEHYSEDEMEYQKNVNAVHKAAHENNLTDEISSIDPTLIESKTSHGMTPLMCAAYGGACDSTTVLLENYSANINAMDNEGWTPLLYAIKSHRPSIVQVLLSHGARTCWKTEDGKLVDALHGAVVLHANYDGCEPEQIVKKILDAKDCDASSTNGNGDNVLHLLVRYYYATNYKPNHRVLQLILRKNATLVNIHNRDGLTPRQLAENFLANFTDEHWHAKSLRSFIFELEELCNRPMHRRSAIPIGIWRRRSHIPIAISGRRTAVLITIAGRRSAIPIAISSSRFKNK